MRSHPAFVRATFGVWLSFVSITVAAAEPGAPADSGVRIESSTCPHALVEAVQHLARVELSGAGLPDGAEAPRVVLTCAGRVVLIRAVLGTENDSRQLDLDQTDDALRARVIALASAELVRDTASRAARPAPPPPPLVTSAPVTPVPSSTASDVRYYPAKNRLVAFAKLSNFGSSFQPLYGAGLGFSHDLGRFALGLSPELMTSKREVALGSVHVFAADLSVRLALRFPSRVLPSELGLGHALGLARIEGTTHEADASGSTVSGTWAGPFVFGGFEAPLGAPCFLQVAAQVGVVTFPIRGQVARAPDVGVSGFWGGLSLGLGLGL